MINTHDLYAAKSLTRAQRWHKGGLDEWSFTDWACALAGEVGELCNAIKKLRRVEDQIQGHDGDTPQPPDVEHAMKAVFKEIGDSYAYLDLLAQRCGFRLWDCARDVFNQISVREKMPERIFDYRDEEMRRAVEAIATDRDFVLHSNNVTASAIETLKALTR